MWVDRPPEITIMHKPEPPRCWSAPWRDVTTPALEDNYADVGTMLQSRCRPADPARLACPPWPVFAAAANCRGPVLFVKTVLMRGAAIARASFVAGEFSVQGMSGREAVAQLTEVFRAASWRPNGSRRRSM